MVGLAGLVQLFGLADAAAAGPSVEFGFPLDCELESDCFLQQAPDMDPSDRALDPLCGTRTYNGHKGWDIRVPSMPDLDHSVAVLAMADGRVERTRDSAPDRLVTPDTRRAVKPGTECGNAVLIRHAGGYQTLYCHMRRGSIAVHPGQVVRRGEQIGAMGASGLAAFPHLHVSVRKEGVLLDPLSGQPLNAPGYSCNPERAGLFSRTVQEAVSQLGPRIIGAGLSAKPPNLKDLVREGPPEPPVPGEAGVIAWVWLINLAPATRIRLTLSDQDGRVLVNKVRATGTTRKAEYLAFAGRRIPARKGSYSLMVEVTVNGEVVLHDMRMISVGDSQG